MNRVYYYWRGGKNIEVSRKSETGPAPVYGDDPVGMFR